MQSTFRIKSVVPEGGLKMDGIRNKEAQACVADVAVHPQSNADQGLIFLVVRVTCPRSVS